MSKIAKFPSTKSYNRDKIYESDVPLLKETSNCTDKTGNKIFLG